MARLPYRVMQALALHQRAEATARAAARLLQGYPPASAAADHYAEERALTAQLRATAAKLAPGWLDAPLDALAATTPLGGSTLPTFVRVGQAHPLDDTGFPVMVPLLGAGHVAMDADARDLRVAGLLRTLVLRLLAAAPRGSVQIRIVDSAGVGAVFSAFQTSPPIPVATDEYQLRSLLTEAETWVSNRPDEATNALLLVIASLPELTDGQDLDRISALGKAGPAGRLHIIAAGWPPPPLTAETTQRPLPYCTQITLRNPHAWVGDPPGTTFAADGIGPGRLNAPVYLDRDPPPDLVRRVCAELAAETTADGSSDTTCHPPISRQAAHAAWREYVAAAQRLDSVRRQATAVVTEHSAIRAAALQRLSMIRARLINQSAQLGNATAAAGLASGALAPDQGLVDSQWLALAQTSAPPVAADAALRDADALLDAADAALGTGKAYATPPVPPDQTSEPGWPGAMLILVGLGLLAVLVTGCAGMLFVLRG